MTPRIRIVVAEDNDDVREAVRLLIDSESDLACVGDTGRFEEVTGLCESSGANVLVLDVEMSGQSGLSLLPILRTRLKSLRIVMFSGYENPELVRAAAAAGAAYVAKSGDVTELLEMIRRVASHEQHAIDIPRAN